MENIKYEKALKLKDSDFKILIEMTKDTAKEIIIILKESYAQKHKNRGRDLKLSIEEMLSLALEY